MFEAVIFDFGGVFTASPFEAFARYERNNDLPPDLIRKINGNNYLSNAWARFERGEIGIDEFDRAFGEEALAVGHYVSGREIIALLSGEARPEMHEALVRIKARYKTGCITNNVPSLQVSAKPTAFYKLETMTLFDHVIESSKVGLRKPDPRIYAMMCEVLQVAPQACIYLDDLGVNLKPARAMACTPSRWKAVRRPSPRWKPQPACNCTDPCWNWRPLRPIFHLMCGKFTQMMSWGEYVSLAELLSAPGNPGDRAEIVLPMRDAFVLRLDPEGRREVARMRWGLIPPFARDSGAGSQFIHARGETIDATNAYKDSFRQRRGLVIVSEFFESRHVTATKREPHRIWPDDGKPVALACIWSSWRPQQGAALETFAIITVAANALIAPVHDRMPAVIAEADWPKWLGETPATYEELKALLRPCDDPMSIAPVARTSPPPRPPRKPDQAKAEDAQPDLFTTNHDSN